MTGYCLSTAQIVILIGYLFPRNEARLGKTHFSELKRKWQLIFDPEVYGMNNCFGKNLAEPKTMIYIAKGVLFINYLIQSSYS